MIDNTEQPMLDTEGETDGPRRYLYSELEHALKTQALLVEALRNIRTDCQTAAERQTPADWDFAVIQAIDYANAALKAAGVE